MQDALDKSEARAVQKGDCRYWEPLDAVHACARDMANGVLQVDKLYIAIEEGDGTLRFFCAGASKQELVALLEAHVHKTGTR